MQRPCIEAIRTHINIMDHINAKDKQVAVLLMSGVIRSSYVSKLSGQIIQYIKKYLLKGLAAVIHCVCQSF